MSRRPCEVCGGDAVRPVFEKGGYHFARCASCELFRIDPQPTDAQLDSIYGAGYFDAWGAQEAIEISRFIKIETFRRLARLVPPLPPDTPVLDCGAAYGFLMDVLRSRGYRAYGVELSPQAAQAAQREFGLDRVFAGPFEQARFDGAGEGAFGAVFMCDFLEHVREPRLVLAKAARLLGSGGFLLLVAPDGGSLTRKLMGKRWPHFCPEHLFCFDRRNLGDLLAQTGFDLAGAGDCNKTLCLDYIRHQLGSHHRSLVARALGLAARVLPKRVFRRPFCLRSGQMWLLARKR